MEGRVLSRYRVTERIGAGGMAEVYAARHEIMGREAAIKLLLPQMSTLENIVKRFFQEAQAAASIKHPGIVGVFDVGYTEDGRAYIIMERLSGETLKARLDRIGTMALGDTLRVMRQLASVMDAAHDRGIVHRDLKPDNIFLVEDPMVEGGERVKVLDFGLAKLAEHTGTALTAQGTVFGTPAYMAPEQCRDAGKVDQRADLYSMGCIMYRCLCGRPPFGAGNSLDVLSAHLRSTPLPPRKHDPSIPAAIDALILRLLEKSPDQRIRSCAELVAALSTGEVPEQDTLIDDQGSRTGDITLIESGTGPVFEPEPITDVDGNASGKASGRPVPLPGVPGAPPANPAPEKDDEVTLLGTRRPATDVATGAATDIATGAATPATPATTLDGTIYAAPAPVVPRAHVRPGSTSNAAVSNTAQRHATSRRVWLVWAVLGLVLAAAVAVAVALAMSRDDSTAAPAEADAQSGGDAALIPSQPGSIEEIFDQHTARAKELIDQESWTAALAEIERALALTGEHGIDGGRVRWARRLQEIATQEQANQAVFERFTRARDAGQVAEAVRASQDIPADSAYREKARRWYEQTRDAWLDKARNQAQELSRRGACDDIDALAQQAQELFAAGAGLQEISAECARRRARNSAEARELKHQELIEEVRNAYKGGEYGRSYRVCSEAHQLAPRDQETALLCGMAACRLKKHSSAQSYHSKLDENRQNLLLQLCMKQGIKLSP